MARDLAAITGYHAHVYYDPETRDAAAALREGLAARFPVTLGRWHDRPVGPHSAAMYQVAFAPAEAGRIIPWLMLNHGRLSVFIHPLTGDDRADHDTHALWLGDKLPLDFDAL